MFVKHPHIHPKGDDYKYLAKSCTSLIVLHAKDM
jgi:hypothetical protein